MVHINNLSTCTGLSVVACSDAHLEKKEYSEAGQASLYKHANAGISPLIISRLQREIKPHCHFVKCRDPVPRRHIDFLYPPLIAAAFLPRLLPLQRDLPKQTFALPKQCGHEGILAEVFVSVAELPLSIRCTVAHCCMCGRMSFWEHSLSRATAARHVNALATRSSVVASPSSISTSAGKESW